jgi:hypothetical protein
LRSQNWDPIPETVFTDTTCHEPFSMAIRNAESDKAALHYFSHWTCTFRVSVTRFLCLSFLAFS